jgi:hypothetical protein
MQCRPAVVLASDSASFCSDFPLQGLTADNVSNKHEESTKRAMANVRLGHVRRVN